MGKPTDLHKSKASHMSVPVASELEFHLREEDLNHPCKVGEHYLVAVPCICTSLDDGTARFKQEGTLRIADNQVESTDSLLSHLKDE